ncbi:MAG TPA: phytanoyl-CoA dioxygenase family protein [Rhizomicrobium sp.]|jgi:ectoine hydroxylase-related dioxygenase (phytanoyl-CoA dioxygenase family)
MAAVLAEQDTRGEIDPGVVEAFQRDGFVHVRGLLDPAELESHRAIIDRAVANRTRQDGRGLSEKTPFEQSFTMCQYLWEDYPEIGRLTFHPKIAGLAAALIGAKAVRLWHDQALYKEAHGRETEMHQDQPYWPIAERDSLTAWIPLVNVAEEMGCMGYIPGSHLGGVEFIDVFTTPGQGQDFQAKQTKSAVFVPCSPGDVIFHHGRTIHAAKPNLSNTVRRAHTAIYFRDGCTRANDRAHYSLDRDAIKVGAPIDGKATPIAWPLPGGRLPEPIPFPDVETHRALGRATKIGIFPSTSQP